MLLAIVLLFLHSRRSSQCRGRHTQLQTTGSSHDNESDYQLIIPSHIFVGPGTDISALAPEFTLTPGATIDPPSGTATKFPFASAIYCYGCRWLFGRRTYTVSVIDTELATIYNFEDTLGGQKYYIFVEREGEKVVMEWASGNAGYAMTGVAKTADDYPTFQFADGKAGKCLSLVTRSTGFFGSIMQECLSRPGICLSALLM